MKSKFHLKCKQCGQLKGIKCVVSGSNFGLSDKIFTELFHLQITLPHLIFFFSPPQDIHPALLKVKKPLSSLCT